MKRLYLARNPIEAQQLRLFLEAQGIRVALDGESNAFLNDFYLSEQSRPGVYVNEADWARAEKALHDFHATSTAPADDREWQCEQCNEEVPWHFEECWKCSNLKSHEAQPISQRAVEALPQSDDAVESPSINHTATAYSLPPLDDAERRDAWIELGAVLSVAWLPFFYGAVESWLYPELDKARPVALDAVWTVFGSISITSILLFVMYRSNLPWRAYGITKPKPIADLAMGIAIWIGAVVSDLFFLAAAGKVFGYGEVYEFTTSTYTFGQASSTWDNILLIPMCIAIGLSEEISMRAYLIPRFEQLLGSAWAAVTLSSIIFASYHIYQGVGPMLAILVIGLVFGTAFALSRRLWPVAIGHAIMDLLAAV